MLQVISGPVESDLQGAVAAVQVVQARRVNELLVYASQSLHSMRENQKGEKNKMCLVIKAFFLHGIVGNIEQIEYDSKTKNPRT